MPLHRRFLLLAALVLSAWPLVAQAQQGPVGEPRGEWREQVYQIPLPHDDNRAMHTLVLRPVGKDRAPLAVINHGSPANAGDRPGMKPGFRSAREWFLKRGFVVALPMRRGYGETGGAWAEEYGRCANPDYKRGGLESAKDIQAAVDYLTGLPFVEPERAIVVGQSAGGWASVALASQNPARVAAIVNFAGGRGGYAERKPNNNCAPDKLVEAAGDFGKTARIPMLWIFTQNDLFFAPQLSARMADAFKSNGGIADYQLLPPFGKDGHSLFANPDGGDRWQPLVARFLTANGR